MPLAVVLADVSAALEKQRMTVEKGTWYFQSQPNLDLVTFPSF